MRRLRPHLTYANVMVTLLAFVVLCGGTAFAVDQLGKNSVGAKQLKPNAVTGAKVKDGSLRPKDIRGFGRGTGAEGPPGPAGPSGIGPAYQAYGEVDGKDLSTSLFGSKVITLPVPPGAYFVTATLRADTFGADSFINCRLLDGAGGPASEAVIQRGQDVGAGGLDETFTMTGAFQVGTDEALNLSCNKGDAGPNTRIIDATLVAVQVSAVTGKAQ